MTGKWQSWVRGWHYTQASGSRILTVYLIRAEPAAQRPPLGSLTGVNPHPAPSSLGSQGRLVDLVFDQFGVLGQPEKPESPLLGPQPQNHGRHTHNQTTPVCTVHSGVALPA